MHVPRLGAYLEEWLERRRTDLRPTTLVGYRQVATDYLIPHLGHLRLDDLDRRTIERVYALLLDRGGRRQQGLAPRTIVYAHAVLHRALKDAQLDGLITENPAHLARTPRRRPGDVEVDDDVRVWTAEEVAAFLAFVDDHPLRTLWHLAVTTGMRRGELLGLRWVDADLDRSQLLVRRSLSVADGVTRLLGTKTSRARVIGLSSAMTDLLARHHEEQAGQRAAAEAWTDTWGLVFTGPSGAPIPPASLTQEFRVLMRHAPVPAIRLHDIRHSHASLLLQAGVPVKVVSARLGHAKASMTLDVYAHVLPATDEEAALRFQRAIEDGSNDGTAR